MSEETPEETARKFALTISQLIEQERELYEKAARVADRAGPVQNRRLAQEWFATSAKLLLQYYLQCQRGFEPEIPLGAIKRMSDLAEHFAAGYEPAVAKAARDKERNYLPAHRRDVAVAVFYARAAKPGQIKDKSYNKTIREAYGVDERQVRRWIEDGDSICEGFAPPDLDKLPSMLSRAGGQYRFNFPKDLDAQS